MTVLLAGFDLGPHVGQLAAAQNFQLPRFLSDGRASTFDRGELSERMPFEDVDNDDNIKIDTDTALR